MIRLFYTNSKNYQDSQQKPEFSLGGYLSSTLVPNGEQNSLFDEISPLSIQNEIRNIIGLILKNEGDDDLSNIQFYFDIPENSQGQFQIAAVSLSLDSKNQYVMELLPNNQSLPYYADFHDADGIDNAVSLGPLKAGGMLGLWIKRTIDFTAKTDDDLWTDFQNAVVAINKELIGLIFNEIIIEESSSSSSI